MAKVKYELAYGPDRSHDALYSIRFPRLKDARFAATTLDSSRCWRIVRIAGGANYTPAEVTTVAMGGPDEEQRKEHERFRAQYETARAGRA